MSTELVRRQFGMHAQNYVASADHAQGESLERMLALLPFAPAWRALDVATGGGHTALAIAPFVREVVAGDVTAEMLVAARRFLQSRGVSNVTFGQTEAGNLPFANGAFDLVTCRLAAHHFPQAAQFVRESARVLRPGGWFALIDNVTPPDAHAARHINAFEKLRDPSHVWEYAASDWEAFCLAAGLTLHHVEHYRKLLDFELWCDRLSVPLRTREQLRVMLWHAPAVAREALNPQFAGDPLTGPVTFTLGELLLLARRPYPSSE
ncbi:MAG: class I SAM-dependent methyltransferase [Anaerolineales bacterium]|nr:class I SAM-dependent methyltransferase [Anaerolineales bacterium]